MSEQSLYDIFTSQPRSDEPLTLAKIEALLADVYRTVREEAFAEVRRAINAQRLYDAWRLTRPAPTRNLVTVPSGDVFLDGTPFRVVIDDRLPPGMIRVREG